MSFLHIELLRGLAMAKLEHLQPAASDARIVVTSASARALALARLAVTSALVLLCLAGELEQLALDESAGDCGAPEQVETNEFDVSEERNEGETPRDGLAVPASFEPLQPVQCRWCLCKVICSPGHGVLNEDGTAHECGSFLASPKSRKRRKITPDPDAHSPL